MTYAIGSRGSLTGVPHYLVTVSENEHFDFKNEASQIIDFQSKQPTRIVVDMRYGDPNEAGLEQFCADMKEFFNCQLILIDVEMNKNWDLFDYVIYQAGLYHYDGVPANELWLYWDNEKPFFVNIPTRLLKSMRIDVASVRTGNTADLLAWVSQQPFAMTISK